jgi:hypothetical protein
VNGEILDGVNEGNFLVYDQIRIVRNASGNGPDGLEQGRSTIIYAHPIHILDNGYPTFHRIVSPFG